MKNQTIKFTNGLTIKADQNKPDFARITTRNGKSHLIPTDELDAILCRMFELVYEDVPTVEQAMTEQEVIANLFAEYRKSYANTPAGQTYPQWFTDEQIRWIFKITKQDVPTDKKLTILTAKIAEDMQHSLFYIDLTIASYKLPNGFLYLDVAGEIEVITGDEKFNGMEVFQKALELGWNDTDIQGLKDDDRMSAENWFRVEQYDSEGELVKEFDTVCSTYDQGLAYLVELAQKLSI